MSNRRAGAPRLIDWTGERCVPWAPDVQVVYEHYHRYLWARELVAGRRVLDLGSGEGFGAALLADSARSVMGVDIDALTVEHARLNYAGEGLSFQVGSATDLADVADDSFDAVVVFEVVEHVTDQDALMRETSRVLVSGGLLILSTPDRRAYSDATGQQNPFHERELTQDELRELIGEHFVKAAFLAQRVITGSKIEAMEPLQASTYLDLQIERLGEEWREAGPPSPFYLLCAASNDPLPPFPSSSTMADYGLTLMRIPEGEAHQARADAHAADAAARAAAAEAELEVAELRETFDGERAALQGALDGERAEAQRALDGARSEREELEQQLLARTRDLELRGKEMSSLAAARDHAIQDLGRFEQSILWCALEEGRRRLYGAVGGRRSVGGRAIGAGLRLFGRLALNWRSPLPAPVMARAWQPIVFPELSHPEASIVIPVHSGATLTERCLHAILTSAGNVSFEVILVDDQADPDTKRLLGAVSGARVIVNLENVGFLRSVNRGAKAALAPHVVLLNNDTEPQAGWLDALVRRAESASDIGVVATKLVSPNGELQEAGGIVWRNGTASNYGRGQDCATPEFNYVREVDYGSAAALLVRTELWRAAGGFDERFVPGYWEDVDLCFQARAAGWRVVYEPAAIVTHVEGGSMGTDVTIGGKRHQELNQPKFAAKWQDVLCDQRPNPSAERSHIACDRRRGPVALIVDHRIPMADHDAGSLRMLHMVRGLDALGCRVIFLPDNLAAPEPYTSLLRDMGVQVLAGDVNVHDRISRMGPRLRLAILSRPYVAPRYLHLVRRFAPSARVAYDTVDLHFLRELRRARQFPVVDMGVSDAFRHVEVALARASDVTLVATDEDREHLHDAAPEVDVEVMPMAHDPWKTVPGPEGRAGLMFVGSFDHEPNVDAALYLAHTIMPLICRELGDVTLSIVGARPPTEVRNLATGNIEVTDWVQDLNPMLRTAMVNVAPLRYGAGMKGKVTQSLAAGLPVVTSTVGAEGLGALDGEELFVADEPELFAQRVADLHCDAHLWRTLSTGGQDLVSRVASPDLQVEVLRRLLDVSPLVPVAGRV